MLGTLVALAVARMVNLETFVWDMPTGVLRDVWIALSSLADRNKDGQCRLERVWVRWHDNSDTVHVAPLPPALANNGLPAVNSNSHSGPAVAPIPSGHPLDPTATQHMQVCYRVETPNFSILPPLKALSVLDIDEPAYLEEMAILLERSVDRLKELRVGIAEHAQGKPWTLSSNTVVAAEGLSSEQIAPSDRQRSRAGGVLGMLLARVSDLGSHRKMHANPALGRESTESNSHSTSEHKSTFSLHNPILEGLHHAGDLSQSKPELEEAVESPLSTSSLRPLQAADEDRLQATAIDPKGVSLSFEEPSGNDGHYASAASSKSTASSDTVGTNATTEVEDQYKSMVALQSSLGDEAPKVKLPPTQAEARPSPSKTRLKLAVDILELERVPLAIPVLRGSIDWSRLTALTILRCPNHEQLWKFMKRSFSPTARAKPVELRSENYASALKPMSSPPPEYRLQLKRIHTDAVSPSLISFLKESLAPNSLEWLFLQETRSYNSPVTIEALFKGPIKRHRASLKKLLIDSAEGLPDGQTNNHSRWRKWVFSKELLSFVTSGKMCNLRELGMSLDYRDWHTFLQSLPNIPQLRSLYLPYLADHVNGRNLDPRELALQIVDIVSLKPEMQLCYMGIASKCFEVLEVKSTNDNFGVHEISPFLDPLHSDAGDSNLDSDLEDGDVEEDDINDQATFDLETSDLDETETEGSDSMNDSDDDSFDDEEQTKTRLRLREILFYDDKVSVFKARHGRL